MSPYSCRQTEYRDTKRVKETMLKTPRKKAHIIKKLTQSPRTKKVLVSEGILPNDEVKEGQLFSSLQKSIEKLKPQCFKEQLKKRQGWLIATLQDL
jgi:hypothetical protein